MSLADWLASFRQLHERARRGQLSPREQAAYRAGRDELARAMLAAQRLAVKPGELARRTLRIARALQLDVELPSGHERVATLDLSTGGFSCLLASAPPLGAEVRFELRIPAAQALSGRARVSDVKARGGSVRVAFTFLGLTDAERERVETFVLDAVLTALSS